MSSATTPVVLSARPEQAGMPEPQTGAAGNGPQAAAAGNGRAAVPRHTRTHPVRWLRLLRAGILALILAAGLLCLLVASEAHGEITTATGHGAQAVSEVSSAYAALTRADTAVASSFRTGDVALVGPGTAYEDDITAASQDLVLAAGDNVAGLRGANTIQFADGLLGTYRDLVAQATTDFADNSNAALGTAGLGYAHGLLHQSGGLLATLHGLRQTERAAVASDLRSSWLNPRDVWLLLLAPFLAMLLLAACTSYVLWHGFRRLLSVRLTAALVLTLGLVALVASLNAHDGAHAKAFADSRQGSAAYLGKAHVTSAQARNSTDAGMAYSPWTLVAGLILAGGSGALAFAGYWPRLDEYRYRA